MEIIFYFLIGLAGAIFGCCLYYSFNEEKKDSSKIMAIRTQELKRHDIEVAIIKDNYLDDPVETVARVKREFADELLERIDDLIEVEDDKKSGHIRFYVSIWTKEAADEGHSQEM